MDDVVSIKNNFAIEIFLNDKDGMEWIMDYFDQNGKFKHDKVYVGAFTSEKRAMEKSWFSRQKVAYYRVRMKVWAEERLDGT